MRLTTKGLTLFLIAAAAAGFAAPSASAASEFGDSCTLNKKFATKYTLFEISSPANPMPTAAPAAGVITRLKTNVLPVPAELPVVYRIVHPLGPGSVQVVAEESHTLGGGANSFATRIPVSAGDRIGLSAAQGENMFECESTSKSLIGGFLNGPGVGGIATIVEAPAEYRIPAFAVLEPDADSDGYGDETQDKCPRSAAIHLESCPTVSIDSLSVAGRGLVTVYVAVSSPAPVAVSGTVKVGKGKPLTLKAPSKTLTPGPIGKFKLNFPAKLKSKLKELTASQSLQLKVSAAATTVTGSISADNQKVRLKGQAKGR
jgi:hypothetical protein